MFQVLTEYNDLFVVKQHYFAVFLQDFISASVMLDSPSFPLVLRFHYQAVGWGLLMCCMYVVLFASGLLNVAALKSPSSG